jgi:hypothetical protein
MLGPHFEEQVIRVKQKDTMCGAVDPSGRSPQDATGWAGYWVPPVDDGFMIIVVSLSRKKTG